MGDAASLGPDDIGRPARIASASCSVSASGAMPSSSRRICAQRSCCLSAALRLPDAASSRISRRWPSSRSGSSALSCLAAAMALSMSPASARACASRCSRSRRSEVSRWRSSVSQSLKGSTGICRPARNSSRQSALARSRSATVFDWHAASKAATSHRPAVGRRQQHRGGVGDDGLAGLRAQRVAQRGEALAQALAGLLGGAVAPQQGGELLPGDRPPVLHGEVGQKRLRLLGQAQRLAVAAFDLERAKEADGQLLLRAVRCAEASNPCPGKPFRAPVAEYWPRCGTANPNCRVCRAAAPRAAPRTHPPINFHASLTLFSRGRGRFCAASHMALTAVCRASP